MSSDLRDTSLEAFVQAWNTDDLTKREHLLRVSCAKEVTFHDEDVALHGRAEIAGHIGAIRAADDQRTCESLGWVTGLGGRRAFRWRLRDGGGTAISGRADVTGDDGGLFATIACTTDPPDPPPDASATTTARLRTWALANPLAIGGLAVLGIYVALRWQADTFYHSFHTTPEDAGFGTVDLVMRQSSSAILRALVGIGLTWSAAYAIAMLPNVYLRMVRERAAAGRDGALVGTVRLTSPVAAILVTTGLISGRPVVVLAGVALSLALIAMISRRYRQPLLARADDRRKLLGTAALFLVGGALFSGMFDMISSGIEQAKHDALGVKLGDAIDPGKYPWQARPVSVRWKGDVPNGMTLPGCRGLTYLGEGGGRVLLYDLHRAELLRVSSDDVELAFPDVDVCRGTASKRHAAAPGPATASSA
jgi:hypothetical protein